MTRTKDRPGPMKASERVELEVARAPVELQASARKIASGYRIVRVYYADEERAWCIKGAVDDCTCGRCWEHFWLSLGEPVNVAEVPTYFL